MSADFYTAVLRRSGIYWVALCLENGLVGQGKSKENAIEKLKESIESLESTRVELNDIEKAPVTVGELHEFLMIESTEPTSEAYELRAVNA